MMEDRLWLKSSHDLPGKIFRINWLVVLLLCALATVGYVALYSAAGGSPEPYATRHIVRFAFGLLLMICISLIDIRIIARFSWIAYVVGVALLVLNAGWKWEANKSSHPN
jgi:rod shape determining protein RodA